MNCICFLWFFKKVLSSNINTREGFCLLNNSILKDKYNDEKIQKDCNKRMRIERECDMTVDSDKSIIDVGSEEFEMKDLQNVYNNNKKLKQDDYIDDTTTTSLRSFNNDLKDTRENDLTKSSCSEPLDFSCKSKNNLVCLRSDALPLNNTVVYNPTRADTFDKNVDLNFLETLKNNNGNVVSSYAIIANTNTNDVFKKLIFINCPSCNHSFLATPYNTILHDDDEQELENLFSKLEKKLEDLMEAKEKPVFSNIYALIPYKISKIEKLHLAKISKNQYSKFQRVKKRIDDFIIGIFKQLIHQQISWHRYILIDKVLKFTIQVFVFINEHNSFGSGAFYKQPFFDDRLKHQKYRFTTIFSGSDFLDMVNLTKKILNQDQCFYHKKEDLLNKYLKGLCGRIEYISKNLNKYTSDLDELDNFYMKLRKVNF